MTYALKDTLTEVFDYATELASRFNIALNIPAFNDKEIVIDGDQTVDLVFLNTCFSSAIHSALINSYVYLNFHLQATTFKLEISFRSILSNDAFLSNIFHKLDKLKPENVNCQLISESEAPLTLSITLPLADQK